MPSVLCSDGAGVADPFVLGPPVKCQALGGGTAVAALVGETHGCKVGLNFFSSFPLNGKLCVAPDMLGKNGLGAVSVVW